MTKLYSLLYSILSIWSTLIWGNVNGQMLGDFGGGRIQRRQNGNNGQPDTSAFNIVNGRIFTPGLGIILAPQPFTPMGGDFLHIALDVGGDGKLSVPPQNRDDPLTQVFNITLFLTSDTLQKNFTISNITTTIPPFADIMNQELSQTVKHINFEWPACLVGNGREEFGETARGDYNISIHQNFRINGSDFYSIFNLPISVTNSISQFPGANQLLTKPPPGPLNANGGRMSCDDISNPVMGIAALIESVNNPPGQPYQDIVVETTAKSKGGQVGTPGTGTPGGGGGDGDGDGEGIGNGNASGGGAQGLESSANRMGVDMCVMIGVAVVLGWGSLW
ncbi:hypothetical protein P154DRAFT_491773 [Amniculicola lignicola CBS 123094]|uniref:Uncharacterized protein n=1 Tax=Amniculicola lignicola CBS 123094 TaxID=1392246 RepID=A0A6A5WKC0_9PLEO|nr:hypothetical protein P154DRAFT_491773 [Amniculicola lignicola CBS 123094]